MTIMRRERFALFSHPDALTPTYHSLPDLDPHRTDLRSLVTDTVVGLADVGALDESTVDVLHNWIHAQHQTWIAGVHRDAEQRRFTAARLVAVDRQNLEREANELAELESLTDELAAVRAKVRRDFGLDDLPTTNADAATQRWLSTTMLPGLLGVQNDSTHTTGDTE